MTTMMTHNNYSYTYFYLHKMDKNKSTLPKLIFAYDNFFTLTERNKWIDSWHVEDLTENEKAIFRIALQYYGKRFEDIELISSSIMTKNSFIELLVKFKNIEEEELVIIRRINHTKFKISVDDLKEQREIVIGYIKTFRTLYKQ